MTTVHFALGGAGAAAAGRRGDVVVIVDALRASVTTAAALAAGAARVVPMATVEEARDWLGRPVAWVAGEREGVKVLGFDLGNSPVEMLRRARDLHGCTLIHTTTNGTRCTTAAAAHHPPAIFTGSLPNATHLVGAVLVAARQAGAGITLVAAGVFDKPVEEDDLAVAWLARMLAAAGVRSDGAGPVVTLPPAEELYARFAATVDGRTLIDHGLSDDVEFCARLDALVVVPVYRDGAFVRH
ncbi:MAG: 2-phosphosulfolactate phosphatase [Anaerolineae bacterium]|nr:2-phosphosulfolactate phosphatase [Anaerolineae bacterium]